MNDQSPGAKDGGERPGLTSFFRAGLSSAVPADGKKLALILAVLFIALSILLFPPSKKSKEIQFNEGDIANTDVIAPFDFLVPLSAQEIEINRARAAVDVLPVFREKKEIIQRLPEDLESFMAGLEDIAGADSLPEPERISMIKEIAPGLRYDPVELLLDKELRDRIRTEALSLQADLLANGIVNDATALKRRDYAHITAIAGFEEKLIPSAPLVEQGELEPVIAEYARNLFNNDARAEKLFYDILRSHLTPNLIYDALETKKRREDETAKVPAAFKVSENQRIIAKHDKVTRRQVDILEALESDRARYEISTSVWRRILIYLGSILRISILVLVLGIAIYRFDREILEKRKKLALGFIVLVFYMLLTALVTRMPALNMYLVPVAFVPLVTTAFFGVLTALIFTLFASFMLVTHAAFPAEQVFISAIAGAAAIISVTQLRERRNFYTMFLYISIAYIIGITSFGISEGGTFRDFLSGALWGITNGFVCTVLVMFLLPIFESLFNVTTNFTLMELSDLNRPLLKRLIMEAPGTYHHSLMLGNMVEAAAFDVKANGLLARVTAYYHDIGKLTKPEYFFENQGDSINKHEKLAPTMSALILASHVREGVELAKREKLPDIVIDGIREHHGTTVMAYFYNKALEYDSHDGVNIDDFRYPGPRPRSKETALVMLADSSEAAVRSLKEPTAPRIRAIVGKIFESRMNDGELDDSGLTLNDISVIKEKYIQLLTGIFHPRIPYPKQEKEQEREVLNEELPKQQQRGGRQKRV